MGRPKVGEFGNEDPVNDDSELESSTTAVSAGDSLSIESLLAARSEHRSTFAEVYLGSRTRAGRTTSPEGSIAGTRSPQNPDC